MAELFPEYKYKAYKFMTEWFFLFVIILWFQPFMVENGFTIGWQIFLDLILSCGALLIIKGMKWFLFFVFKEIVK